MEEQQIVHFGELLNVNGATVCESVQISTYAHIGRRVPVCVWIEAFTTRGNQTSLRYIIDSSLSFSLSLLWIGEVSRMKIDRLALPSSVTSDGKTFLFSAIYCIANDLGFDSLNTIVVNEKIDGSEPCWDGYQVEAMMQLQSINGHSTSSSSRILSSTHWIPKTWIQLKWHWNGKINSWRWINWIAHHRMMNLVYPSISTVHFG